MEIHPGYDGEYGKILVMNKDDVSRFAGQISLFEKEEKAKRKDASFAGLPKPVTPSSPVQSVPSHPACDAKTLYGLNDGQWQGVSATDTVTAVLAGPGTGKTRTLVYRVAYLVEERGVDPVSYTHLDVYKRQVYISKHNRHFLSPNQKAVVPPQTTPEPGFPHFQSPYNTVPASYAAIPVRPSQRNRGPCP